MLRIVWASHLGIMGFASRDAVVHGHVCHACGWLHCLHWREVIRQELAEECDSRVRCVVEPGLVPALAKIYEDIPSFAGYRDALLFKLFIV